MLKVNSYSSKGIKGTQVVLPKEWETKLNIALLSQAIHVYNAHAHIGLASTKTRAEVNRTTKKLYKQKGTGGARHGSRKAPIFVGGGVVGGPRPVKRELNLPSLMKRKAVAVAISQAAKEDRVIAATLDFKKASEAQTFIKKITGKVGPRVTFILGNKNIGNAKFLRNIKNAKVLIFPGINAMDIFYGGHIIFDKTIFTK